MGLPVLELGRRQDPGDQEVRTEAPPAYALDARRLHRAFLDLVGRPPFRRERERWGGRGMIELLDEVLGSEAYWENWRDEQLYFFLLIDNFRPESDRVQALPVDLAARRIGVRDAVHRIVLSSSFDQRNPGADTFVSVVMEQLLGITVQDDARELDIGKQLYDGQSGLFLGSRGDSQADVVQIAIDDKRFDARFLEREYERVVRERPDRRELAQWARELRRRPLDYPALVRGWMLSPAYERRLAASALQPNRMFVRSLFVDLLDRLPSDDEARRMRAALDGLSDPGPLRSVLARLLIDSGAADIPAREGVADPTKWVAELFARLLGRAATQEELREFVTVFHDPACRPSTLVYALVSHPEYHRY